MLRQKLNAWKNNFGSQGFQILGLVGDTDARLRIFPIPQEAGSTVVVEFLKKYTVADITEAQYRYFKQWVDYFSAQAAANHYSQTAGIEILGFKDSTTAVSFWERRAATAYERATRDQHGIQGQMART
jgi:hypothetical protein